MLTLARSDLTRSDLVATYNALQRVRWNLPDQLMNSPSTLSMPPDSLAGVEVLRLSCMHLARSPYLQLQRPLLAFANRIKSSPSNWSTLQPYLGALMEDMIQVSSRSACLVPTARPIYASMCHAHDHGRTGLQTAMS